ncbi:hypothetical protein BGZ65_009981, partial [Modicella reniformis]
MSRDANMANEASTSMAEAKRRSRHLDSSRGLDLGLQQSDYPAHQHQTMETLLVPEQDESDSSDDEGGNNKLPVLTIELVDPEGSCFSELLYWLYTDNGPRWLSCFTPQNYGSILENIRYLNIWSFPSVIQICQEFEQ